MKRLHLFLPPVLAGLVCTAWTPPLVAGEPAAVQELYAEKLGVDLKAFQGTDLEILLPEESPQVQEYLRTGDPLLLVRALPELFAAGPGGGEARPAVPEPPKQEPDPEIERIFRHHAERMAETRNDPRKLAAALYLGDRLTEHFEEYESVGEDTLASIRETLAEEEAYERANPTFLGVTVDEPVEPFDDSRKPVELFPEELADEVFRGGKDEAGPEEGSPGSSTTTAALTAAASCTDPTPFWPPGPLQVSEYMRGTVTAVIFYLNRRGGVWGPLEMDRQRRVTKFAHVTWEREARSHGANLSFRTVEHHVDLRGTSRAPNLWTENLMVYSSLLQNGVSLPGRDLKNERWWEHDRNQVKRDIRQAANYFRQKNGTDWAYLVFAVDAGWDTGPKFALGYGAYAMINGGGVFMNSTAWEITGANHYSMTHELGHVFGALDHYRESGVSCGDRGGYLGTPLTVHEDGRKLAGCTDDSVDIMDRWSRVWLSRPVWDPVPITAVTRSQVGMTGIEGTPYVDLKLTGAYRLNFRSSSLYLYTVRYEAEVGAKRRVGPNPGMEPDPMPGAKPFITAARLASIEVKHPWKTYKAAWPWDLLPVKSSGSTQVQCGVVLTARWDRPAQVIAFRVRDESRHGSTGGWLPWRFAGAKIVGKNGGPITLQDHRVVQGGGESLLW